MYVFFSHPFTVAKWCRSVLISKTRLREITFINFKVILKLFWIRLVSYSHAENEGGRGENYTRTNISLHSVYMYECYILIRLIYLQYACNFINKFNIFGNYWQFECALLKGRLLLIAKKSKNNEGKYFFLILVPHMLYTKITHLYTQKTCTSMCTQ